MFICVSLTVSVFSVVGPVGDVPVYILKDSIVMSPEVDWTKCHGAKTVQADQVPHLVSDCLLVIPACDQFPADAVEPVLAFIDRGGHVLFTGGPPFQSIMYEIPDGKMAPFDRVLATLPHEGNWVNWSVVGETPHLEAGPGAPGTVHRLPTDGIQSYAEITQIPSYQLVSLPVTPSEKPANVLRFHASGNDLADILYVEVREEDGSRWGATVPLTQEEQEFGLLDTQFELYGVGIFDTSPRQGDHLRLNQAREICFGFASSHHAIKLGPWQFSIHGIGYAYTDLANKKNIIPDLVGLYPEYSIYYTEPARLETVDWAKGLSIPDVTGVYSSFARPMGLHPDRDYAWQPLVKAYNKEGIWSGTPVATTWGKNGGSWTYVGLSLDEEQLFDLTSRLTKTIAKGPDQHEAPGPLLEPNQEGSFIQVQGDHLTLDNKRWDIRGINYYPGYIAGQGPPEYYSAWLRPHGYIPEQIEGDLDVLHSFGVNFVSIAYVHPSEAPQLCDFIARCAERDIRVNIYVGSAHPTQPSDDDISKRPFLDLLREADLANIPGVFGFELAWEPHFGDYEMRCVHDPLFDSWIREQYGSIERAEEVWGIPIPRREDGHITGPTDDQLVTAGPHSIMVAAYRRFADDLISRRYREVVRIFREFVSDKHILSARTGWGGTGSMWIAPRMPYQLTSGAAHLDMVTPEGYGIDDTSIALAGFINQYARWAGNNKPVFWGEFGMSVWNGGDIALERQQAMYEAFPAMAAKADAAGVAGWWYAGGYRVDEKSDYGVVNPDRSLRPAAVAYKTATRNISAAAPGPMLVMHRDEHPAGIAYLVAERSSEFVEAWKEDLLPTIQTPGSGTTSKTCPFTGVGGVPFTAPQAPEYLNAEVVLLDEEGDHKKLLLINTGEATWVEDCTLRISTQDGVDYIPLSEEVPRFGRTELRVAITGNAELTLHAERFGDFGERLQVNIL